MPKKKPPRNKKIYGRSTQSWTYRPTPPIAPAEEVWKLIDGLIEPAAEAPKAADEPPKRRRGEARRKKRLRQRVLGLDVVATVAWVAVIVKLFIGDLDRVLLASVAPQVVWILDLRWFLVLALAALLLLLFRNRTLGLGLAYVLGYPLVLLFWKLPKLLIRRRSPLLVVVIAGFATSLAARARLFVYALALACLSALIIVLSNTDWLVGAAMVSVLITLVWWLIVTSIDLLRSTSFISAQEKVIETILDWNLIERFMSPQRPDRISLNDWGADDAKAYRDSAGNAVLANRILRFWAYSLDQYRKGPSVVILNALVVIGLVVQVVVVFTFLNYGVYVINTAEFSYSVAPNWWTFAYYSAAGSFFGEVNALAPVGSIAIIVKLLNGLVGTVGVVTVIGSIFIGYRNFRSDATSFGTFQLLEGKAEELEELTGAQFQLTIEELEGRLIDAGWGLLFIAEWLASKTPSR